MPSIRKAEPKDHSRILKILHEADLYYPGISFEDFWVSEKNGIINGIVQLKDYGQYFFLSALGVSPSLQKKGIGSGLVKRMIEVARPSRGKNIYLYSIIPEYFEKFGFKPAAELIMLPKKDQYLCAECFPQKCKCMVWENK